MSGMKDTFYGDQLCVFHGSTYVHERDFDRLSKQARCVAEVMANGSWFTLSELHQFTGHPEASISARIRDINRVRGIEKQHVKNGLWRYRLKTKPVLNGQYMQAAE